MKETRKRVYVQSDYDAISNALIWFLSGDNPGYRERWFSAKHCEIAKIKDKEDERTRISFQNKNCIGFPCSHELIEVYEFVKSMHEDGVPLSVKRVPFVIVQQLVKQVSPSWAEVFRDVKPSKYENQMFIWEKLEHAFTGGFQVGIPLIELMMKVVNIAKSLEQ